MSGKRTPDVIVEPVVSKVTKIWTTMFARKMSAERARSSALPSAASKPPTSRTSSHRWRSTANRDFDDLSRRHHHRPLPKDDG